MESRKQKKNNQKFITLILIIAIAIVSTIYFAINRTKEKSEMLHSQHPPAATEGKGQKITLFFVSRNKGILIAEEREVETYQSIPDQIKECLRQLIQGPRNPDLSSVLSPRTNLQGVFMDSDNGIAYVDFSPEIRIDHPGGPEAELLTIYAIINSLCQNFPTIKKVQILIDGHEEESLAGHVFIQQPLMAEWTLWSRGREADERL